MQRESGVMGLFVRAERVAHLAIFEWIPETGETSWSAEMYRLLGLEPGEIEPSLATFEELMHPEDRPRVLLELGSALGKRAPLTTEIRIVRADGSERRIAVNAELLGDDLHYVGVCHDLTAREEIDRRLRASEERFRIVAQATHDAVWDCNLASNELWFSDAIRALGWDVETVPFDWWLERIHPGDRVRVEAAFVAALEAPQATWTEEYRFRTGDGRYIDILDRGKVVRDERGVPVRVTGSMQDISSRNAVLKQLEEKNAELAEFAYVVSHDLKAPLRGIASLADWIAQDQRDRLDDEGREQLALLLGRVRRMNDLIDGILRYSRIGRTKDPIANVDVKALVAEVVDSVSPPDKVEVRIAPGMPVVAAPRTQLGQVFQNLIANAVRFCDPDDGLVDVACTDLGNAWRFVVADNGAGIEQKHFDRIFQLFQTLQSRDASDVTGSTGIGLTIVKKIVETYGGRVWVESRVGNGSRFFFTLPKETRRATCEMATPSWSSTTTASI